MKFKSWFLSVFSDEFVLEYGMYVFAGV